MRVDVLAPATAAADLLPNVVARQCALAGAAPAAAIWLQPLEQRRDLSSSAGVQISASERPRWLRHRQIGIARGRDRENMATAPPQQLLIMKMLLLLLLMMMMMMRWPEQGRP